MNVKNQYIKNQKIKKSKIQKFKKNDNEDNRKYEDIL